MTSPLLAVMLLGSYSYPDSPTWTVRIDRADEAVVVILLVLLVVETTEAAD